MRGSIPFLMGLLAGCGAAPVAWEDAAPAAETVAEAPAAIQAPRPAGQCTLSVRTALGPGGRRYAIWWSLRENRTADLLFASSDDGTTWTAPQRIDTLDTGRVGCFRPPPAIAADGFNVHVVYSMEAPEGPGFFLTHSMDRGGLFHQPVAVVYGARPGRADVAAKGNFVVVAYEDPNSKPTRISVAVSNTMAHLFQYRQAVSPPGPALAEPQVTTDGQRVTVSWRRAADPAAPRIARAGTVR